MSEPNHEAMEFEYGRGVTGCRTASWLKAVQMLEIDIRSMDEKWGIDEIEFIEFEVKDGNIQVSFRYDSEGWRNVCK